jgi:hypothetical protein
MSMSAFRIKPHLVVTYKADNERGLSRSKDGGWEVGQSVVGVAGYNQKAEAGPLAPTLGTHGTISYCLLWVRSISTESDGM